MEYFNLREKPSFNKIAAKWFNDKWSVPTEAYLECINDYINNKTEYGWYICVENDKIIGGLGVIKNDFHLREDLTPNICAVYTEKEYRCKGIAGHLLNMAVEDLKNHNISPVYLITEHTSFYERYNWQFYTMVETEDGSLTRMYIHK